MCACVKVLQDMHANTGHRAPREFPCRGICIPADTCRIPTTIATTVLGKGVSVGVTSHGPAPCVCRGPWVAQDRPPGFFLHLCSCKIVLDSSWPIQDSGDKRVTLVHVSRSCGMNSCSPTWQGHTRTYASIPKRIAAPPGPPGTGLSLLLGCPHALWLWASHLDSAGLVCGVWEGG